MSYESGISHTNEVAETSKQDTMKLIPEKPSSPLMFDEDIFSVEVYSHDMPPANQVITTQKSSSDWMTPKNHSNITAVVLSMSQVEHVTTCLQCDKMDSLNESTQNNENHNRSISDIAQTMIHKNYELDNLESGISPKRARLHDSAGIVKNAIMSTNTCDFLKLIEDQSRMINDQLASLHEER